MGEAVRGAGCAGRDRSVFGGPAVALLETISPEQFSKKLSHPERGEMTLQTVVETMGGHDLNHIAQLETIAGQP
jgi:hypothetical protein